MRTLTLALGLLLSFVVQGQQQVAKKIRAANGINIGYYEFTPKGYNKNQKHPLIIFLHGISERGNGGSQLSKVANVGIPKMIKKGHDMEFKYNGKKESFVVLSPQLSNIYGSWQSFYVEEMIKYAKRNLGIDENRIYVTGLSLGGGGVWGFASKENNAKEVAAIVPICGTCMLSNPASVAKADLPVWAFHAKNDSRVSVKCTENAINRINLLNPNPRAKKTIWSSGNHNIWDKVYSDEKVFEWMLSNKRSKKPSSGGGNSNNNDGHTNYPKPSKNKAPIADAGSDRVTRSSSAFVNGSNSRDTDGRIVKYHWKKLSGPSSYNIVAENYKSSKISRLSKGTYVFALTVTDDDGASSTSRVTITRR
jgi:hypothetical protein